MPKQSFFSRFPPYIPWHFRWYCFFRRFYRQTALRYEKSILLRKGQGLSRDGSDGVWEGRERAQPADTAGHVNKSAHWKNQDLARSDIKAIVEGLEAFKKRMGEQGLKYVSPSGTFLSNTYVLKDPVKIWEEAWCLRHAEIQPGMRVLDVGGASTPFSFYIASKGTAVEVIDNDWGNCGTVYNANYVARKMSLGLKAIDWDVSRGLPFADKSFDRIFSICVIEHLPSMVRRFLMKEIGRVLMPGGLAGFTTDYDPHRRDLATDRGLRFGYLEKFREDVLKPSGLKLVGNTELVDIKEDEFFCGAFFLH